MPAMTSHPESIARRMITRLAPSSEAEAPSSPTDETTDESATGSAALPGGSELVLTFAPVLAAVAAQAWAMYTGLDPNVVARRAKAAASGDMPALQRETVHLKQLLLRRLQAEAVTPPELPESGRARILDAAAEETLAEVGQGRGR
jgi:hypothetical protein